MRRSLALLAVVVVVVVAGGMAARQCSQPPPPPTNAEFVPGEIIVRTLQPLGEGSPGALLLDDLLDDFDALESCCPSNQQTLYRLGTRGVAVPLAVTKAIEKGHGKIWAQPNFIYSEDRTPNDDKFDTQWSLDDANTDIDINAPQAWETTTGNHNLIVAVVDSGVKYANDDLVNRVWRNSAECNGVAGDDDDGNGYIDDCFGLNAKLTAFAGTPASPVPAGTPMPISNAHGTAVAGIAGAEGNNNYLMAGVAWDSQILVCKFYETPTTGTTFDLAECLDYIRALKAAGRLNRLIAVNASWGNKNRDDLVYCAINRLREQDVLLVASAGNSGADLDQDPRYPAAYFLPNIIAVGESTKQDKIAGSTGQHTVHIAAPGAVSSLGLSDVMEAFGGTSAAAPHVTGLAVLLAAKQLQDGQSVTNQKAIKNLIIAGGKPISGFDKYVISGRRLRAADQLGANGANAGDSIGALTCRNQIVQRRLRPVANRKIAGTSTVVVGAGSPILLAAMSISCASPTGTVEVRAVDSSGTTIDIPLSDADLAADQSDADGVFSKLWTPPSSVTDFTLEYRYASVLHPNDTVPVHVVTGTPAPTPAPTIVCPPVAH